MKYAKPALTVEQQLGQLVRRGMAISDWQAARQHVQHINYYRLRAYWLPDEIPAAAKGDHAFRPGTRFETILDLYSFDLGAAFNTRSPKRLYNTLVMLTYMLDIISPRSQWRSHLLALLEQHARVDFAAMGFPTNWKTGPLSRGFVTESASPPA